MPDDGTRAANSPGRLGRTFMKEPRLRAAVASALCLAVLATTGCGKSDPESVRAAIQTFFDSFATNDPETIYKSTCDALGATIREAMKGEEEADQTGKKKFTMTTDSISDIQVVGNTATARVTVHSSSKPEPGTFVATVIKEHGKWKYCTQ
jgi:hypothetical protein